MTRFLAFLFSVLVTVLFAADQSSKDQSEESFEVEPPLLIPNRADEPLPVVTAATPVTEVDVARLEKEFERAKGNAAGAERLCKIGVLSKVEAERCALRVMRLESDLANVRLARARAEVVSRESRLAAGELANDELEAAKAALAQAIATAQVAAAKRERAELDAAEANLRRQEKLLALGSARKSDVARAEAKLAELKVQKN